MDLVSHQFISYFEPEQADKLCQLALVEYYPEGSLIFEEGEVPDYLYLVLTGEVEFSKSTGDDHYQVVTVARPNSFFGEFGVLDGQPRSARAIATPGGATLAKISRDHLMTILQDAKGQVVLKLFGYITQQLRNTTNEYVNQMVHKQKMELLGEMVNTIVHDFRSPFTGIQLSSSMIRELHPDEETEEWCDLISMQIQRMLGMAEEVLEFSRGSTSLVLKPVAIGEIIQQFEKLNRVYLHSSDVELNLDIPEEIYVLADLNKIIRVLQNLVSNAVEAFPNSQGKIIITATTQDNWGLIMVKDDGPGIPKAIQEHLFDAFVTYGKQGGTGLGTAIAKSIVEAHGGAISFESVAGVGTTFWIRLPLNDGDPNMQSPTLKQVKIC
ncbi:MAG: cyclic nucleotide-binding domain-containing protein [Arthrospira sp. SH-MAG29]|nr:ATP-binding protein [Arthrospira sp. SH-MAG29]MBS0016342.1 cyclic nucleotide-binding domain-containing protein [Arthrospira sp. SH-MAG29]